MEIQEINEAIYASSNGVIVERRKSIIIPIITLFVGVALLVLNYFIDNGDDANNLKSALVLVGGALSLAGSVLSGMRIFGEGAPYHTTDGCFLVCKQYSFAREQEKEIVKVVNSIDKSALDGLDESSVMALLVVCYYSPKGSFVAMQAFAYSDFVYKPISELKIKA